MIRNKGEKPSRPQNHSPGFAGGYSFRVLIFAFLGGLLAGISLDVLKEESSARSVWIRTIEREKRENLQPYVEARESYCKGDVSGVVQILETEQKLRESFAPASVLMRKALFFQGRIEEAEDVWKSTLDRCPWNQEARKWLARLYLQEDQGKKAEQACIHALVEDPEDPKKFLEGMSFLVRARFHAASGDDDKALDLLYWALNNNQISEEDLRFEPDFEFIREKPRFRDIMEKLSEAKRID